MATAAVRHLALLALAAGGGRCAAAGLWEDVTEHHDAGRALREEEQQLPDGALVRRLPSPTVFVYKLSDHQATSQEQSMVLPLCTGGLATFTLQDSGLLPEALQRKFPDVRTYHGRSAEGLSAEITLTPKGVRAQVWMLDGKTVCYVDPHSAEKPELHTVYAGHDVEPGRPRRHGPSKSRASSNEGPALLQKARPGGARRLTDASGLVKVPPAGFAETFTYKLVVAVSAEYVEFAEDYGGAMALLAATLQRAGGIWSRSLGIKFVFAEAQDKLLTPEADELPNNNNDAWMDDPSYGVAYFTEKGIPVDEYDIGHFFSVGDAGGMGGGFPCDATYKTYGGTAGESPKGDSFDVEYVAHEMGHQFGTSHTWSGAKGSCTEDQFMAKSAVELGSGSTLETYAGICEEDNIAAASQPYFHVLSLSEFQTWSQADSGMDEDQPDAGGKTAGCGVYAKSTTNHRPTAVAPARCTVPRRTPFWLEGSAADDDASDTLTYTWEQLDSATRRTSIKVENEEGPLFISKAPSATGNRRDFPAKASVLDAAGTNTVDPLERLSTVRRSLHFAMTARDQFSSADGTFGTWHAALTTVDVSQYGPLRINMPAAGDTLSTGASTVSFRLEGVADAKADIKAMADSKALMGATFSVHIGICGTGATASAAGCGDSWTLLASGVTLSEKGVAFASVFIPAAAAGKKVVLKVQGEAEAQAANTGCGFYTVTPMLSVSAAAPTAVALEASFPADGAADVAPELSRITLKFSKAVFLIPGMSLELATGGSTVAADVQVKWSEVMLDASLSANETYTVTVGADALCASETVPCPSEAKVAAATVTFTTADTASGTQAAPAVVSTVPAAGGYIDHIEGKVVFTYDQSIVQGQGHVAIYDDEAEGVWCELPINASGGVEVDPTSMTFTFYVEDCWLYPTSQFTVVLPAGAVRGTTGTASDEYSFKFATSPDTAAPVVTFTEPLHNGAAVPEYSDVFFLFNEEIFPVEDAAGISLTFKAMTAGKRSITVPLTDCCSDETTITIAENELYVWTPGEDVLDSMTQYSLIIPPNAFTDYSGNAFPGLAEGEFLFTTGDSYPPMLSHVEFDLDPDAGTLTVVLTFDNDGQTLHVGRRNIFLVNTATNATGASVPVASDKVTIDGNEVTINFVQPAVAGTYALRYNGGVVRDSSDNGVMELRSNKYIMDIPAARGAPQPPTNPGTISGAPAPAPGAALLALLALPAAAAALPPP